MVVLGSRSTHALALGIALTTLTIPAPALAREPEVVKPKRWNPKYYGIPLLHTVFGGGSYLNRRLGVFGGDVLAGFGFIYGDDHAIVFRPTVGWSGWRTTDKPASLRANTFTGRFDIGYANYESHLQGVSIFGAARVGTGRGPEDDRAPFQLAGAQVGLTYWAFTGYQGEGFVGLEFQSNFTHALDEWDTDLRFMVNLNFAWLYGYPWDGLCMLITGNGF